MEYRSEMTEYDYPVFEKLLQEGQQVSKDHDISLTDFLLLRQLITLQGVFNTLANLQAKM